jgi:hypothetical protein
VDEIDVDEDGMTNLLFRVEEPNNNLGSLSNLGFQEA